ncbi:MAG: hypothetical protein BM555_03585 [Crocinitomix sp. MedPE-SWsnd]|nr:MAG: hypothetical protein BM555_03585 [Crocinitomix sp. MedPE-SWsnd]
MDFTVYILKSSLNGRCYIGQTQNIKKRLGMHNSGLAKSTKAYAPWILMYTEKFESRKESVKKERHIKSWKKRIMIEKLLLEKGQNIGSEN